MTSWFRGTSWFQRFALLAVVAAVLQLGRHLVTGEGDATAIPAAAVLICFYAFRQQLLWRVRNRLLLTYFLLGVVPIVLIALMLNVVVQLGLGQFASSLVRQELQSRTQPPSPSETFDNGAIVLTAIVAAADNILVHMDESGMMISTGPKGEPLQERPAANLPPAKGFWDVPIASVLAWPPGKTGDEEGGLVLVARPSALMAGAWSGPVKGYAVIVLSFAGGFLLLLWLWSVAYSIGLTRTITGSVHELYLGTLRVAQGDFGHQIPVRGKHQLSELATSFNSMTTRIEHLIGEVKKKEKLEAELEIARGVQLRLFPDTVPDMATLEMTGVCIPGRVVSGDYYDFVKLDERNLAIALGDVSGKGVSAALLMAGIQSALHSQLKYGHADAGSLSTAALMQQMSQQLYDNTPPEKYATFFCAVYDDQTGMLRYTNAGHLKPILVREGQATSLEGDGLVAGLLPNVTYDEHEIWLRHGDLVALFSDGVPEAEDSQGREFGEEHLSELLREHAGDPLAKILTMITGAVNEWIHDPDGRDDTTIVLFRKR